MTLRFDFQAALLHAKEEWNGEQSLQLSGKEIDRHLNKLEDNLMESPIEFIEREFDNFANFLGSFNSLGHNGQTKLISLIAQILYKVYLFIKNQLDQNDLSGVSSMKSSLEKLMIITHVLVTRLIVDGKSKSEYRGAAANGGWEHLKISLAENLRNIVSLQLGRIFDNLSEKETFVLTIVRTVHLLLEQPDNAKLSVLLDASLVTLAIACKLHACSSNIKTIIIQDLTFFEHLAEPCARLVALTSSQYEYPQLSEDIYRELGGHNFTGNEANTAKLVSLFLVKHSEIAPKDSLKYLNLVVGLLDVESSSIRMAIVEMLGKLIGFLQTKEDRDDQSLIQSKSLFSLLEERLRDVNAFVRCKVLSVLGELCRIHAIPVNRRTVIVQLVINRVKDKSSNVRRRAIQLLGEFIKCHPFGVDGGELDLDFFTSRLAHIEDVLNIAMNNGEDTAISEVDPDKNNQINALLMQKKYYQDASQFVEQINSAVPTLCLLLTSNVKTEVFEVMDFFVDACYYKIKTALTGVRKMMQLIWEKDLSMEDGGKRSIKEHLIESYLKIYICSDDRLHAKERLIDTTQNLIK